MPQPISISDAEWEVMRILWDAAGAMSANDVVAALAAASRRRQSPRTVKTYLNRLLTKGAIRAEARGKVYWYAPRASRDACVRTEARSFLSRVFGGDAGAMLVHFVENAKLSDEDLHRLRTMLDRKNQE